MALTILYLNPTRNIRYLVCLLLKLAPIQPYNHKMDLANKERSWFHLDSNVHEVWIVPYIRKHQEIPKNVSGIV